MIFFFNDKYGYQKKFHLFRICRKPEN